MLGTGQKWRQKYKEFQCKCKNLYILTKYLGFGKGNKSRLITDFSNICVIFDDYTANLWYENEKS